MKLCTGFLRITRRGISAPVAGSIMTEARVVSNIIDALPGSSIVDARISCTGDVCVVSIAREALMVPIIVDRRTSCIVLIGSGVSSTEGTAVAALTGCISRITWPLSAACGSSLILTATLKTSSLRRRALDTNEAPSTLAMS